MYLSYTLYYIQPGLKAKLSLIFVASQTKRQNKSKGLISQTFCTYSTPFVHFFGVVLHDYNVKLPDSFGLDTQRFMEEMSYVFLFAFFSLPAHFHLGGRQNFSISHRRYKIFLFLFQKNQSPFFFITGSSSFSVIHVNVDI